MRTLFTTVVVISMLLIASIAWSKIIYVPGDYPTIQAGIDAASNGDTILVADGIYTADGNRDIDFKGKAITVKSKNGPENCIIDCEGAGQDWHRGFYFHSGETEGSVVNGFTIQNGWIRYGGGIYCSSISAIINNTIARNVANTGGGIFCYSSTTTITNTILWGDNPQEIYFCTSGNPNTVTISYSDIQGGRVGIVTNDNGTVNWLDSNINANPLFVAPDNGNYYLQAGSSCLGNANCESAPSADKDGRARPLGNGCDMGCYEQWDCGFIYGDVSWDCNVTAYDAALALQYIVGSKNLFEGQRKAADVTYNGIITALDAALILEYTVGLITLFPVQTKTAAPVLAAQSEEAALIKAITQLETTALNRERKQVLEQLKHFVFKRSLPKHTALLQNFPNPFNPETWLPYKLASASPVSIKIYNAKGQLICTISLGNKPAGIYTTKSKAAYWDGRDRLGEKVASGVYYYTLEAGEFRATRKMVIMK